MTPLSASARASVGHPHQRARHRPHPPAGPQVRARSVAGCTSRSPSPDAAGQRDGLGTSVQHRLGADVDGDPADLGPGQLAPDRGRRLQHHDLDVRRRTTDRGCRREPGDAAADHDDTRRRRRLRGGCVAAMGVTGNRLANAWSRSPPGGTGPAWAASQPHGTDSPARRGRAGNRDEAPGRDRAALAVGGAGRARRPDSVRRGGVRQQRRDVPAGRARRSGRAPAAVRRAAGRADRSVAPPGANRTVVRTRAVIRTGQVR